MPREQSAKTFAERVVERFVPDRARLAEAIHKLLWEKGDGAPLALGELRIKNDSIDARGLRALFAYMTYRVGGFRRSKGNYVRIQDWHFTVRWTANDRRQAPIGWMSFAWYDVERHINERALAECSDPFELADALCEVLRLAAQAIDDPSALERGRP